MSILCFQTGRIGVDEEIDQTKGKSAEEIQEMMAKKEEKANAQILTMVCQSVSSLQLG